MKSINTLQVAAVIAAYIIRVNGAIPGNSYQKKQKVNGMHGCAVESPLRGLGGLRGLFVALCLLFPFLIHAQTKTINHTLTGTWGCPTGVTSITVECWGGGGAGAAVGGSPAAGGGGAGGAYARKTLTVVPGTVYNFTVGAQKTSGGKAVLASANNGNPTWFGTTSTVFAAGGPGAAGGADANNFNGTGALGTTAGSLGDVVYAGGNGANGASAAGVAGGAGGGAAGTAGTGGNATAGTGGAGGSGNPATGTGANGPANSTAGANGATYGGGGAGGKANTTTDRAGGRGAAGYLRITFQNNTPTSAVATAASATQINITWADNNSNETGYEIWTAPTLGGTYSLLTTTAANATGYSHTNLTAGTAYYYKLKAINTAEPLINSLFTGEITATTLVPPAAPENVTAAAASSTALYLNWTDVATNETGYQIERSLTQGNGYNVVGTTGANATAFTDNSLTVNTTYYYRVRAVNTTDNGAYSSEANATTLDAMQQTMADLTFQYKYDHRKRMTAKKVPGADWVFMVYDNRDRLVLTQDGNQRRDASGAYKNEWTFTKYDALNRPVLTGIYTHGSYADQAAMQAVVNSYYATLNPTKEWYETYSTTAGHMHLYDNRSFPTLTDPTQCLTVTYYDNYNFRTDPGWGATYGYTNSDNLQATVINGTYTQPSAENTRVIGQVTGSKTKVLDAAGNTYLKAITYYDDKYRPIQAISDTYLGGTIAGTDRATTLYDFPGKVLMTKTSHNIVGNAPSNIITRRLEYDHAGRLLKTFHQVDGQPEVLLAMNVYNELGQLIDKKLHSTDPVNTPDASRTFKQSVDYRYNIRGWLKSMNNAQLTMDNGLTNDDAGDLFGMELGYNDDLGTGNTANLQYNGNINAIKWSNNQALGTTKSLAYNFSYDAMNRLVTAGNLKSTSPTTWATAGNDENIMGPGNTSGYDLNGNIKYLNRTGTTASTMDVLGYSYNGNQLLSVTDTGDKTKGFIEPTSTSGNDYTYDVNGNMTVDQNKGITAIAYNHLNLPAQVTKNTGEYIKYIYDATGRKLRQEVYNASNVLQKSTDYAGEFIYENNALQFINHEEGRVVPPFGGQGVQYQYHLKDHLGNVRLTFTTKQETEERKATYEPANSATEQGEFLRYSDAKLVNSPLFDKTNGTATGYAQRLSGSANEKFGLAKSISVMPGDVLNFEVFAKYIDPNTNNWTTTLATLVSQITANTAGVVAEGGTYATSTPSFPYPTLQNTSGSTGDGPKAYLNWLIFDRNYTLVADGTGYKRLSQSAREYGQDVAHERLAPDAPITIKEPGYVYIYLSNEEATPIDVFFDEFNVTVTKSPVVQQDDYYPFGLTFNSYSRENSVPNHKKFNGIEEVTDLGLNVYQAFYRTMDPTIGRWWQIDPKAENYISLTPYNAMGNNPVRITDPLGDDWETKKDSKKAEKFDRKLKKTGEKLQRKEAKLDSKIASATAKGNTAKAQSLTTTKNDISARRTGVADARRELQALGTDRRVDYSFASSDRSYGYISRGMNDADGTINITINSLSGNGNLAHELKHAFQYSTQQIHMFAGSDVVRFAQGLSPINVEIQAYQRQYAVDGAIPASDSDHNQNTPDTNASLMNQINAQHVRGIYYNESHTNTNGSVVTNQVFLYNGPNYQGN